MCSPKNGGRKVRKSNYWLHRFRTRGEDYVRQDLHNFLDMLETRRLFLGRLRRSGGSLTVAITWSARHPSGFVFDVEILSRISRLRLDLSVEAF